MSVTLAFAAREIHIRDVTSPSSSRAADRSKIDGKLWRRKRDGRMKEDEDRVERRSMNMERKKKRPGTRE